MKPQEMLQRLEMRGKRQELDCGVNLSPSAGKWCRRPCHGRWRPEHPIQGFFGTLCLDVTSVSARGSRRRHTHNACFSIISGALGSVTNDPLRLRLPLALYTELEGYKVLPRAQLINKKGERRRVPKVSVIAPVPRTCNCVFSSYSSHPAPLDRS